MASLKTRCMWKMSKIIEALCRGEHMLKFYRASHLEEIGRQQPGIRTSNFWIKGSSTSIAAVYLPKD